MHSGLGLAECAPMPWIKPHLWRLLIALCDWIVPADGSRVSASEARAPDWLVFVCDRDSNLRNTILGGLCLMNCYSLKRFGSPFLEIELTQQEELITLLAFRVNAEHAPELAAGVNFFATLRHWVLNAFFTSRAGHQELGYLGNVPREFCLPCPPLNNKDAARSSKEDLCPALVSC